MIAVQAAHGSTYNTKTADNNPKRLPLENSTAGNMSTKPSAAGPGKEKSQKSPMTLGVTKKASKPERSHACRHEQVRQSRRCCHK
jgi:hypothetical protein